MDTHVPVLLDEVLESLNVKPDGVYVDATFGRGGHSDGILKKLGSKGKLIALDQDPDAIKKANELFGADPRFSIAKLNFSQLDLALAAAGYGTGVDGILFDLGVSSPQLDNPDRGFSFSHTGPLDMRMDTTRGVSASDWLLTVGENELARVIKQYGEERNAKRIARAIVSEVNRRKQNETVVELTTQDLAQIVASASARVDRHKHPATRTFQAIRIFINQELDELTQVLPKTLKLLRAGGRLVVISFHSLEDRIVKRFMRDNAKEDPMYAGLPNVPPEARAKLKTIGRAVKAGNTEVQLNPRSRSAVLRVAERLA